MVKRKTAKKVMVGDVFGRLVVSAIDGAYVSCKCNCGNLKKFYKYNLLKGKTRSCGCLRAEVTAYRSTSHGISKHPAYKLWKMIKDRCYNPNVWNYNRYGGRGVRICDEWLNDPVAFVNWAIENGYRNGLQIDKDINGDGMLYSPSSCSFVTALENSQHRRSSRMITWNSETKSMSSWSRDLGISYNKIKYRLNAGWPMNKVFSEN